MVVVGRGGGGLMGPPHMVFFHVGLHDFFLVFSFHFF